MIAFRIDKELEGGVEVTVRFADGADVIHRVIPQRFGPPAHHCGGRKGRGNLVGGWRGINECKVNKYARLLSRGYGTKIYYYLSKLSLW